VTGRRLFRAENTAATLVKLLNEPIVLPSAVDPDLAPLDPVLKKALDRDPAARFQTAEEFIEALEWAAPRMGGVASRRAVTKAVKQYAGDKLARERKLIESAQRSLRSGGTAELPSEGSDPPQNPTGEVSLPSSSMSRSKPSGVFSNLTAPRLFTRARTARPSSANIEVPPGQGGLAPPPPLGEIESEGVPAAPPDLLPIGVPSNGGRLLIALVVVALLAAGSLTARSWFTRAETRASAGSVPPAAAPSASEAAPLLPSPSLPVSVVEVPKQVTKGAPAPTPPPPATPVPSAGPVATEPARKTHSGSSSTPSRGSVRGGSRGSGRTETQQGQQGGGTERKAGPVLPNPYTR
jgi:hypothetical protein